MSPTRRGFTLVEVALAIAVLAFALVTLIGLLTVGLSSQKSSLEDTRIAAMASYVMASERMNSYATVSPSSYSTNYYFDLQGNTNTVAASYLQCTVTNVASAVNSNTGPGNPPTTNSAILGSNVVPMKMIFIYPLPAPAKTNVFYFNRSNE